MITKRDRKLAAQRRSSNRLRNRNRDIIAKAKAVPCADCGRAFPVYCMDFDHRPGVDKVANIGSSMARWASDPEALRAEIKKCDVVCACCHRIRTFSKERKAATAKAREAKWGQKRSEKREPGEQQGEQQKHSAKKTGGRKALPTWDDGPSDMPEY